MKRGNGGVSKKKAVNHRNIMSFSESGVYQNCAADSGNSDKEANPHYFHSSPL